MTEHLLSSKGRDWGRKVEGGRPLRVKVFQWPSAVKRGVGGSSKEKGTDPRQGEGLLFVLLEGLGNHGIQRGSSRGTDSISHTVAMPGLESQTSLLPI